MLQTEISEIESALQVSELCVFQGGTHKKYGKAALKSSWDFLL